MKMSHLKQKFKNKTKIPTCICLPCKTEINTKIEHVYLKNVIRK